MHHTPTQSTLQHAMPWSGPAQRSCDQVIALVSQHKRVPSRLLVHAGRGRNAASRARQLAMYLAHVIYGRTLAEIGHAFGRDRTTVSYACARIEDLRDDPCFDAEVCALEQRLETTMAAEAADHGL